MKKADEKWLHRVSIFLAVIIIAVSLLTGCGSSKKMISVESQWQSGTSDIDSLGAPPLQKRHYFSDKDFYYFVSNDERSLLIFFELEDPQIQTQTLLFGSTLWISPQGKKEKDTGIRYPLPRRTDERSVPQRGHTPRIDISRMQELAKISDQLELINFGGREITAISNKEPGSVNAVIWPDSTTGNLMYLARIPFSWIHIDQSFEKDLVQKMAIGFETGQMERPRMNGRRPAPPAGGMPPGGGLPPGGNMPRRSGARNGNPDKLEPTEIWFRISLSAKGEELLNN